MKDRKVTIKDVAQKANVSKATVSYVLNGVDKVSEATKQRVLDVIKELGYTPNSTARDLAKQMNHQEQEEVYNSFLEGQPFYKEFMDSFIQAKVGKVPKETKNKLLSAVVERGYLPSGFLEQLMKKNKTTIAVYMAMERDFKHTLLEMNPFYQQFISSVEHTAKENHLSVQIINSNEVHSYDISSFESTYLGIIVLGKLPTDLSSVLKQVHIPIVIVDEYEFHPNFVTLTSEDQKGAFESIEYLILKGHKEIAFVGCKNDRGNFIEHRIAGYKEALQSYGLTYKTDDVYLSEVDYSYEEGIRIAQKIATGHRKYDAVFCTSDIMAIGLMKGFMKTGYKVPDDISIMGFDNIQFSKYSNPELTTVDQNIFLKAETAVTIIIRKAKGEPVKNQYMLPVSIVERESVSKRNK
ncbi:LacI family DNA-binding transcriptional regulator [Bacillus massiliigorillae]|uniref:LacI family DNA-binding transcriptional regulator n=1 Tax=Bacillus massiliigorillae TaxID=1243664 RepID=UPI0003A49FC4|nr:LacI family DNA-binding transcriptional regulator [Bacillus massiliigorillae]